MDKLEFFKEYISKKGENHRHAIGKEDENGNKYIELFDGTISNKIYYNRTEKIKVGQVYWLGIHTCGNDKASGGDGSCEVGARKLSCTAYSVNKCAVYDLTEVNLDETKYCFNINEIIKISTEINENKKFINGFISWQETHFEVVDFITTIRVQDTLTGVIAERQESQGTGGLYELAEEWTDEFEILNKGREWDGEFFDEIEEFCKNKNIGL